MHFDLAAIPQSDAYKLLVSTVVPRPIALATTVDRAGRVNAAPFSFFNAVSSVPPVVVLGISPGDPERYYVATDKMRLAGRMHGRGWYARTSDLFLMERISLAEWKDGKE
jgi:flavin reductase (DIM6/NTAB) family NADH-FMN oxidoreductase RutF